MELTGIETVLSCTLIRNHGLTVFSILVSGLVDVREDPVMNVSEGYQLHVVILRHGHDLHLVRMDSLIV